MSTHEGLKAWINQNYPKPTIDQEWLVQCSEWVVEEYKLDPTRNFDQFIQHVEAQLLQSNLADSTVHRTGIDPLLVSQNPNQSRPPSSSIRRPARPANRPKPTTGSIPLLVEIKSITEIAHSAFSLLNTHQTRLDRADLGLARGDDANPEANQVDEEEGPIPKFPRGMLKFELSDGSTTFKAIEFRSLPQLVLGETPLGYKMILKSTPIRNGIAFLEPSNVTLKGYRAEDHDIHSEQVFLSSLRRRLGYPKHPDPPPDAPAAQPQVDVRAVPCLPPAQTVHAQAVRPYHAPPVQPRPPSPPPDLDDMYVDDDVDPDVLRELNMEMDKETERQKALPKQETRALPAPQPAGRPVSIKLPPMTREKTILTWNPKQTNPTVASSSALKPPSTSSTLKTSPYFASRTSETHGVLDIPDIGLSPPPAPLPMQEPNTRLGPSNPPIKKIVSTSTRPSAAKPVPPSEKRSPSPDTYDDLPFDVDEPFFEQMRRIEQVALSKSSNDKDKDKSKATGAEDTQASAPPIKRTPSKSGLGTTSRSLHLVSPSRAEPVTRGTGSLSSSNDSRMPPSTQPLPRDPSFIVISSSEDEADRNDYRGDRPLDIARRRAHETKGKVKDEDEVMDLDTIDISD